jgi:hypothetical protein
MFSSFFSNRYHDHHMSIVIIITITINVLVVLFIITIIIIIIILLGENIIIQVNIINRIRKKKKKYIVKMFTLKAVMLAHTYT